MNKLRATIKTARKKEPPLREILAHVKPLDSSETEFRASRGKVSLNCKLKDGERSCAFKAVVPAQLFAKLLASEGAAPLVRESEDAQFYVAAYSTRKPSRLDAVRRAAHTGVLAEIASFGQYRDARLAALNEIPERETETLSSVFDYSLFPDSRELAIRRLALSMNRLAFSEIGGSVSGCVILAKYYPDPDVRSKALGYLITDNLEHVASTSVFADTRQAALESLAGYGSDLGHVRNVAKYGKYVATRKLAKEMLDTAKAGEARTAASPEGK